MPLRRAILPKDPTGAALRNVEPLTHRLYAGKGGGRGLEVSPCRLHISNLPEVNRYAPPWMYPFVATAIKGIRPNRLPDRRMANDLAELFGRIKKNIFQGATSGKV